MPFETFQALRTVQVGNWLTIPSGFLIQYDGHGQAVFNGKPVQVTAFHAAIREGWFRRAPQQLPQPELNPEPEPEPLPEVERRSAWDRLGEDPF